MPDQNGPTYYVVFQGPGPDWVEGIPYNEQPKFCDQFIYIYEFYTAGKIVLSGQFMERPGVMAAGGMTIFRAADLEEAAALGTDDPTVKSGMLLVEVKPWWVPFHE